MTRTKILTSRLAPAAGLCIALVLPDLAAAKGPSPEEIVAAAKTSPLFRRALKRTQLAAAGLSTLEVAPGVKMSFAQYVEATALDRRPELAPLFDPKLRPEVLEKAPAYTESILELQDRLVIDRTLKIPLTAGACSRRSLPAAVDELCFAKDPTKAPSKAVTRKLAQIRARLARAPKGKIVHGKVTAEQARAMNDEQLLDLLLNGSPRTIRQVTIVPRRPVASGGGKPLHRFESALETKVLDTGLQVQTPSSGSPKPTGPEVGPALAGGKTFETKYFLTGFTWGKHMEDSWEYTFADATWLTDRYYVRVDYHLGLGFGVRAPFSVDVKSSVVSGDSRRVELSVAPVDVDENGRPAYPAVNLPENEYFQGREFVLELKAGCNLYVSIPGPNFDKTCPSVDKSLSRDIDPVLGTDSSKIADWWLDGSDTGLKLGYAIASVKLDVGLGADVTNGKIAVAATPLQSSAFSGIGAGHLSFTDKSPRVFTVTRSQAVPTAGFRLSDPRYGFDIRLTPKLRGEIEVDVSIYSNRWTLGPYALDFLSIAKSFQLGRHAGTVASHDFELFHASRPVAKLPDDPATASPVEPKGPKLPKGTKIPKASTSPGHALGSAKAP